MSLSSLYEALPTARSVPPIVHHALAAVSKLLSFASFSVEVAIISFCHASIPSLSHFYSYLMHVSRTSLQSVARMKNVPSAKSNVVLALVMVALPSRSLTILKDSVLEKCWSSSVV